MLLLFSPLAFALVFDETHTRPLRDALDGVRGVDQLRFTLYRDFCTGLAYLLAYVALFCPASHKVRTYKNWLDTQSVSAVSSKTLPDVLP